MHALHDLGLPRGSLMTKYFDEGAQQTTLWDKTVVFKGCNLLRDQDYCLDLYTSDQFKQ